MLERHPTLRLNFGHFGHDYGVPQADGSLAIEPRIDAAHIAASIVHMASLPLDANVQFMTVMATKMPFVGRG